MEGETISKPRLNMAHNEIGRRKFIKNVALGGTALLAGSGMAGLGSAAPAASVRGGTAQQRKTDIDELKA